MCVSVCVSTIFPKRKKKYRRGTVPSFKRQGLLFVLCHSVCTFYEKSLYDSRAPTLLSASIHFDLFQGRLTALHSIKGINTETEQITEIKNKNKNQLFLSSINL